MTEKKSAAAGKKATSGAAKGSKGSKEPFVVVHKRSGRYAVVSRATGKYVNGNDKLAVLIQKGLVKAKLPAAKVVETPAEPT